MRIKSVCGRGHFRDSRGNQVVYDFIILENQRFLLVILKISPICKEEVKGGRGGEKHLTVETERIKKKKSGR